MQVMIVDILKKCNCILYAYDEIDNDNETNEINNSDNKLSLNIPKTDIIVSSNKKYVLGVRNIFSSNKQYNCTPSEKKYLYENLDKWTLKTHVCSDSDSLYKYILNHKN